MNIFGIAASKNKRCRIYKASVLLRNIQAQIELRDLIQFNRAVQVNNSILCSRSGGAEQMEIVKPWKIFLLIPGRRSKLIAQYTSRFEAERHFNFLKKTLPLSADLLALAWVQEGKKKAGNQPARPNN